MQGLENADELRPETILEVHTLSVHGAGQHCYLFVLHVHALDRTNSLREFEQFWFRERLGGKPTALLLPDQWWVEALLNNCPNRERGGEDLFALVVYNNEVSTIDDGDLVEL